MMQEEQPRRKPRIPLTSEELFYVKEIKKFKELKRIEDLKKTTFYKIINRINIALAAFLSYGLLSILICCQWQTSYIDVVSCTYGEFNREIKARSIIEMQITTYDGLLIPFKTDDIFQLPQKNDAFYIGTDLVFHKIMKVKLLSDDRTFWHIYTYPIFIVIVFALSLGFFIYRVNKHLSVNGLLTVFGLFALASLYFLTI